MGMDIPKTPLLIRWLACSTAFVISAVMGWMAVRHGLASHWAQSTELEQWQRAAAWEPDNPENWYRLGRYFQIDFEHSDMSKAVANYARATTIAPGSAEYWLNLAEAQETALQLADAEKAFRRAEQAYPLSADAAWRFGNFLLRQNRQDEAYQQIHKALSVQPGLTALAISRCWQSTQDIEKILRLALPAEPDAYWGAIDFLVDAREPDAAMVVWKRLMAGNPSFRLQRAFHLEDMLIEAGHGEDAHAVWQQSLSAGAVSNESQKDGSLVWNGDFEQDLLNGGMGWRFRAVPGAELSFDPRVAHSQGRSLRVEFDGTGNVDFQQPWQYIVLQANTRYRLSAYFRTENLSTSSGIRLELEEMHFGDTVEATANLSGTQPWAPSETEFTNGADTKLYRLVLRRRPSPKLDNKISGTLWMDDVSVVPLVESSALR
jgi:tetratricopeptide (TPR) repeat protein